MEKYEERQRKVQKKISISSDEISTLVGVKIKHCEGR